MGAMKQYQMARAAIEGMNEFEEACTDQMSYGFTCIDLFKQALTHSSAKDPLWLEGKDNERLEFLGDAVLQICITDMLYARYPEASEGQLSKVRADLISTKTLAYLSQDYNLSQCLILGEGEMKNGGWKNERILASTMEALLGAVYLDSKINGMGQVRNVVENMYWHLLPDDIRDFDLTDYKTQLQEFIQKEYKRSVFYETEGFEGPDHCRVWTVSCFYGLPENDLSKHEKEIGVGSGSTIRKAQKEAAKHALEYFGQL